MSMPEQRPGSSRQDIQTPAVFLQVVRKRLSIERFTIDLAASAENAAAPVFFDEKTNSLAQQWTHNGWAWLNPPFRDLEIWTMKAHLQSERWKSNIAMLVPAAVGSNWWRDWVHKKCHVTLLNGRITFVGETNCYPKDCCLLLYAPNIDIDYEVWTWR